VQDKDDVAAEAEQLVPAIHLMMPLPDSLSSLERRQRWSINRWKFRLRHSKYRVVECSDCGDESGSVTYRVAETLTDNAGFTRTFFTWDVWLKREEEVEESKSADFFAAVQLDCEIGALPNSAPFQALPSAYDRARGQVTRECVIIEGRIGDVKLPDPPTDQPDTQSVEDRSEPRILYVSLGSCKLRRNQQ
jgi:hypothetical protein